MVLKGRGQPAGKVSSPATRLLHVCGDQGSRFWVHQVFFNGETVVFKRGTEEQNCAGLELPLWYLEPSVALRFSRLFPFSAKNYGVMRRC